MSEIIDPLYEAASAMPEALAVVTPERVLSYGELYRQVEATARRLQGFWHRRARRWGV